jgi:hypothetical protein
LEFPKIIDRAVHQTGNGRRSDCRVRRYHSVATSENEPGLEEESDTENDRSKETEERTEGFIDQLDEQQDIEADTRVICIARRTSFGGLFVP